MEWFLIGFGMTTGVIQIAQYYFKVIRKNDEKYELYYRKAMFVGVLIAFLCVAIAGII